MLAVSGQLAESGRAPIGARLVTLIEEFYDIPVGSVKNRNRRNGNVSKARWALSLVLIEEVGWSGSRVGKFINNDHKAISYGIKQAHNLLRTCPIFFEAVRLLKEEVAPDGRTPV